MYGPFNLTGATAAQFNLKLRLNTGAGGNDQACLLASNDDFNYFGDCYTGTTGSAFVARSLDLSNVDTLGSVLGQAGLRVAVIFQSDASVHLPNGAFVDDLLLRECTAGTCPASAALSANSQLQRTPVHLVRPAH